MAQIIKRQLKNGKFAYDVRTRINGRSVMRTFRKSHDATNYARTVEADKVRGVAVDPRLGRVSFKKYADGWLDSRTDLAQRTSELYRGVLDRHILPRFGASSISAISPSEIREWNAALSKEMAATAAKAYRLMSTIMRAAMADEVVTRNPCVIKGAGSERSPERPIATVAEVEALTQLMPQHLKVAIALAAWCQLRRGEILGLRRIDVDLDEGTITVVQTRGPGAKGTITKGPKTDAGRRTIAVPSNVLPLLRDHLNRFVAADPGALVLVGIKGSPLRPHVLQAKWNLARRSIGRPDLRLHDLRHTGLTWTAAAGATTAELMHRGGHSSSAAALRYQHAAVERDRSLASSLADMAALAPVIPIAVRDNSAMEADDPPGEYTERVADLPLHEQSQRGSNPCSHLERVVS